MADKESEIVQIDIDRIVRQRAGHHSWLVPRFLTGMVARLIHQDFINGYLRQGRVGVDFCKGVIDYLGVTVGVEGEENLPSLERPCIVVSNHPLGAIDGVTLGYVIGRHYDGHIKYLVGDLLMNLRGLAPLCVPVRQSGNRQGRDFPLMVAKAFGGEDNVIMFPAGLCSRQQDDGQIRDTEWHKFFVKKSVQYHRDVVPVHFLGQNSPRFYRVARFCKRWHLPNLAKFLLPDEMYRSQGQTYTVRIGKPIPWQTFDRSRTSAQWAQWVRGQVYAL